MENGWIKLYRALNGHKILTDAYALQIFIWLLLNVDKQTGSITVGRFQLSAILRMNPNTLKSALQRLSKRHQVITTHSTNKYKEISLVNWAKYQATIEATPPMTPPTAPQATPQTTPSGHQQDTTITRIKNKNKNINKDREVREAVQELLTYWNTLYGTRYSGIDSLTGNMAYWLQSYTLDEIKEAVKNIRLDDWFKDKMKPEMLLRRKNPQGDGVDYIGRFLNLKEPTQEGGYRIIRSADAEVPGSPYHN